MGHKAVRYTRHARHRMALRQITEGMVDETLQRPHRTAIGYLDRFLAFRAYGRRTLKVVYSEEADTFVVITTIWC